MPGPLPGSLVDVPIGGTRLVLDDIVMIDPVEVTILDNGLLGVTGVGDEGE